jgi:hypothetical protein
MKYKPINTLWLIGILIEMCTNAMNKTKDHAIGLKYNEAMVHFQKGENIIRDIHEKEKKL